MRGHRVRGTCCKAVNSSWGGLCVLQEIIPVESTGVWRAPSGKGTALGSQRSRSWAGAEAKDRSLREGEPYPIEG